MSFDRRWLLTTAGSAFLVAFAREALPAPPPPKGRLTGNAAVDADLLFEEFRLGYGALTPAEEKLCRNALGAAYQERFDRLYAGLDPAKRQLLLGFAYGMGNLTYRCLENEKKGVCGWKADPGATLREEHVQRARELLGYHLNTSIKARCGASPTLGKARQADEPCPLCEP